MHDNVTLNEEKKLNFFLKKGIEKVRCRATWKENLREIYEFQNLFHWERNKEKLKKKKKKKWFGNFFSITSATSLIYTDIIIRRLYGKWWSLINSF